MMSLDNNNWRKRSLTRLLKSNNLASSIFWGPPGCGKTTIAKLIAQQINYHFELVSAVTNGTADLKKYLNHQNYEK